MYTQYDVLSTEQRCHKQFVSQYGMVDFPESSDEMLELEGDTEERGYVEEESESESDESLEDRQNFEGEETEYEE